MSMSIQPFAVQPSEGAKLKTPAAGSVTIKADTSQTNGSMTVLEFLIPPNDGPAVHSHLREDEAGIKEGTYSVSLSGSRQGMTCSGPRRGAWLSDRVGYPTPSRTSAMHPGGCW